MADQRDAFLREVDEEVRKDQLLRLWQRWGTLIVAVAAIMLLSAIGYQWWKARQVAAAEQAGARFDAIARQLGDAPSDAALKTFTTMAQSSPGGYRSLARLRVAAEHQKAGRPAEALAEYEALAGDRNADQIFRDYGALQAAMLRIDTADWTEMENRLNPLAAGASAWRLAAREGLALAALKAGKPDVARKQLEQLLDERTATPQLIERASLLLTVLTDQEAPGAPPVPAPGGSPESKGGAPGDAKSTAPATTAPKK